MRLIPRVSGLFLTLSFSAAWLPGAEFKLAPKDLDYEEARSIPGVSGGGSLVLMEKSTLNKPPIKKAPKGVSIYPLRGVCGPSGPSGPSGNGLCFWLDESQGTRTAYDRLVLDLNGNGDLTDDRVLEKLPIKAPAGMRPEYEFAVFGPVDVLARAVGPWRPRVFAEVILYNKQAITNRSENSQGYAGVIRMRPANYLTAAVEWNGERQVLGIIDGNGNFRLGDAASVMPYESGGTTNYYLSNADVLLVDRNGSAQIEPQAFIPEAEPFSGIFYMGGKPCQIKLAKDYSSLNLEPCTNALGRINVPLETTQVVLARQLPSGTLEVLTPEIRAGALQVPSGNYRLANFQIGGLSANGTWVRLESSTLADKLFRVEAGKSVTLPYGPPFKMDLSASKNTVSIRANPGVGGAMTRLLGKGPEQALELRLGVSVFGKEGERYNGFEASGKEELPPPTFTITDAAGTKVESGKFEYG